MIDIKRSISILLAFCLIISVIPYYAFALSWDGSSAGGSTNAVNGSSTGYVIRSTNDSACVVGYRFSCVTSAGAMKVSKVIDVYRNTTNGDYAYSTSAKFSNKYNKKQVIANKNAKLTTTSNTTNCYKESGMGFTTALPNPSGVEAWQAYEANINKVLSKIGVGSVANMNYGDKVIIEPLFDVCLAGEYQALTVSEVAYCGRSVLGGSSNGGTSNGTSSTWGFIANYTNRIWPNKLFTPDGQGLWTAASTIGSSTKATFDTILTKGYGAGIAYNEVTNKTYTIAFNGNGSTGGSTASMSMTYGTAKNLTANGFTKTGYTFSKWNTKADGSGTSYTDKQSVKNLSSTNGATVTLYARWTPNTYTIKFNGNGNTDGSMDSMSMTYGTAKNLTANSFTMTGYTFKGWNTKSDGTGTSYSNKQSVNNLTTTNGATVSLYAQWNPNTYTIKFNGNGSTSGSMASMSMTYDVSKSLTANAFTKSGYHFSGWNTKADGSGTSFYNKQSVKNLTSTNGATVTLYAQWSTNSYTIAFSGNGNTGGITSIMIMQFNTARNLNKNGYTKTGYTFSKWNTKADGSGTGYTDQQSVKNLTTVNGDIFYLYARWTPNKYTIQFNGNGATSGAVETMNMTYDAERNLYGNQFIKTGYIFDGWNTSSFGIGTDYENKQSVSHLTSTNGGTVTLYAKWKPITYRIKFNGNGHTGGFTATMDMTYDVSENLNENAYKKTSYKFVGWNTNADGTGTSYIDKQSVKNLNSTNGATVILYAQWKFDPALTVKECDVYSGEKNDKTTLFGISKGNVFDDYVYKTNYPTIGDTVWYDVYFPADTESFTARQYVRYSGGSWNKRDVTLDASDESSLWFPVQFTGNKKTVSDSQQFFEIQAKTDWIDSSGKVQKSGEIKTFYIPIKPVVYRTQVQARDYEGNVYAYNGTEGSSGSVYSGQHIQLSYKYTADNTYSATEYLRGALYYHNGTEWVNAYEENDGFDAAKNKVGISKSLPVTMNSEIGTYTVPKTPRNRLRFNLQTWWSEDKNHTREVTWIDLPLLQCDIEMKEIRLLDNDTGKILDPLNLEAGQRVKVQYVCKNNINAKVYVEGYSNDKTKINNTIYAFEPYRTSYLPGYDFVVPNKRTFNLWGGVYLEGMGIYNTEYESNGNNNETTLTCKVNHPLTLQPIAQNADYRENTEVVTSFWLNNSYTDDYTPNDNISVRFRAYSGSSLITTVTQTQAIVPGKASNLLYYKWKVPTGLNKSNVTISGEIIEAGVSYNNVSASYSTTPQITSNTPDTHFEKKAPTGFKIPNTPAIKNQSASWWQWTYSSGQFVKKTYAVGFSDSTASITPATGSTAEKIGSTWQMKSGYGLSLILANGTAGVSNYSLPDSSAYTKAQFAVATFPEYEYSLAKNKCTTLILSGTNWKFPSYASYGNVHFTPLWYPDGNYTVSVTLSDMWTPSGMISKTMNTNTVKITDSAYDDWHIGR